MNQQNAKEPLVSLSLNREPSMLSNFPTDINSDIAIILSSNRKNFRLQKALLKQSQYFLDYFNHERTHDYNIMMIPKRFDEKIFEKVLRCFYGGTLEIFSSQDVYSAYQVSQYLKIFSFTKEIEQSLLNDFNRYSFLCVYQLAELYQLKEIQSKCLDYLDSEPKAFDGIQNQNHFIFFQEILDLEQIKISQIKNAQISRILEQVQAKAPTSVLLLQEDVFKSLIRLHNQFKQVKQKGFVSYQKIHSIISSYLQIRCDTRAEFLQTMRKWVMELLNRDLLTASEYILIYHSELLLQSLYDDAFINTASESSYFDPVLSENYLLKKQLQEAEKEIKKLGNFIQGFKDKNEEYQKIIYKHNAELQRVQRICDEINVLMVSKIATLERDLVTTRMQLKYKLRTLDEKNAKIAKLQENIEKMELSRFQERFAHYEEKYNEQLNETVESEIKNANINPEVVESQYIQQSFQNNFEMDQSRYSMQNMRTSVQSKRISFDEPPQTVYNPKQLECLIEFFQVSLFERIGSRDGFDSSAMFINCKFQSDLVVLIRSLENGKVFGFYIKNEIKTESLTDSRAFLFSVTYQKKIKQTSCISIQFLKQSVQIGNDLTLFENNCSQNYKKKFFDKNRYPQDFEKIDFEYFGQTGAEYLAGSDKFQMEEIEVYRMAITCAMEMN